MGVGCLSVFSFDVRERMVWRKGKGSFWREMGVVIYLYSSCDHKLRTHFLTVVGGSEDI